MLPRRVGGAELSLTARFRLLLLSPPLRFAEFQDQLLKLSRPALPLEKGGGGVSGREWGCEADCSEYDENESRMRCSSGAGTRTGGMAAMAQKGPPRRETAPVRPASRGRGCRPRYGVEPSCSGAAPQSTGDEGPAAAAVSGDRIEDGEDCVVLAPMDPYGRRVLMERLDGTGGR